MLERAAKTLGNIGDFSWQAKIPGPDIFQASCSFKSGAPQKPKIPDEKKPDPYRAMFDEPRDWSFKLL
jgi:hypothetical protein